jgi:ABC-type branched-subunit amino acid transport system permease subunit
VIGPFDLESDKSFLVFAVVVLVIAGIAVVNLRSGTFGKTLLALRGSEVGAASIGISPGRARLVAFAISGFLAGIGGALLAMQQRNVNYGNNFAPFAALFWVVIVVTLGSRTVRGAINAAGAFALFDAVVLKGALIGWILRSPDRIPGIFPISGKWVFVLFGLGAIQYAHHPEGIVEYQTARRAARSAARRAKRRDLPDSSPPSPPADGVRAGERVHQ